MVKELSWLKIPFPPLHQKRCHTFVKQTVVFAWWELPLIVGNGLFLDLSGLLGGNSTTKRRVCDTEKTNGDDIWNPIVVELLFMVESGVSGCQTQ